MFTFSGTMTVFEREGGWYYVRVPSALTEPLRQLADRGLIPVMATVGSSSWPTSLLPMGDGTHFIALPANVRKKQGLQVGEPVQVTFELRQR
jgi:hypothetical protein